MRSRVQGIPWNEIAGLWDGTSFGDDRVDGEYVGDAVETEVPEILRALQTFKDENQA